MHCHRINELLDLLNQSWQQTPDHSLMTMLNLIAQEAGHRDDLTTLSDDTLIYQLKMRLEDSNAPIPGLAKDNEDDFKAAILRARGITPTKE
ncbi:hypothetical protein BZG78_11200 [Salinivibrio sp. MA351]|jgi:uncharacterized protein YihD (DUF1040 family)|uniref:YihD family protein n=1 Tax=Salinivibrio TaxID=51366 RepID=UPI00098413FB|nr:MULTISPECIES: YihD family protein [unclassified Salinivibrio]OOE91893.1 hypothetical protein BZG75_09980 [Salinivibrio sp. AR640]OOE96240.1 hypothetical protein BZG77_12360 [Salinivibrio sp. IB643]OOE97540.1 hypothetical protein BZG78_11200 [Salinivibrio sp. MA351]OOF03373.1 hypothetical protein BZG80_10180 [Salinivibrio sp. MA440]OOF19957.1 hypothetical protein BZG79_00955 [Salinivibrio sp. MA427]